MTARRLGILLLVATATGCAFSYDPESVPLLAGDGVAGASCVLDAACESRHCVDGFCCDRACAGQCEACDVAGSEGTCATVSGSPHGSRTACASSGSVCDGTCNGVATTCTYPSSVCRPQSCTGSTRSYAASCSGGVCPTSFTDSCEPYVCSGTGCKTGCTPDSDCSTGNYCSGGSCFAKKAAGVSCSAANQCLSDHCSPDGKCCNEDCTGTCEACNGVNTGVAAGICGTIQAGSPPDPTHTQCTGDASGAFCAGSCNGTAKDACTYPATQCRSASCTSSTQTLAASCSGGSCPAAVTQPCGTYACGATACKLTCGSDVDCASGNYCDGTSHCVAKLAVASLCGAANQCQSGVCADGVCCNVACGGCKACNLPGNVGSCTNVPAGQDPHASCSVLSCQITCNGSGGCSTATTGQICASSSCVNATPLPGAYGRPPYATATLRRCAGTQSCPAAQTAGQYCDGYLICEGPQCATSCSGNSSCSADTLCYNGECVPCSTDADCRAEAPWCNPDTPYGRACDCAGDPGCNEGSGCYYGSDCEPGGWGQACVGYSCSCTGSGQCNGRAPRCMPSPSVQCGCGPNAYPCAVGQLCSDGTLTGACRIAPGFPCTGSGADPNCASGTCSGGTCTKLPAARPCSHASDCTSGVCTTNWTCY